MEIQESHYRISIKALIYNKKWEFLLCKEKKWIWDFPGGWLDHWESVDICLKRELKEEMWLEILNIDKKPKYFITAHKPNSKTRPWISNVFYEIQVNNLDFTPSDECIEVWFFNFESAWKLNIVANVEEFLKEIK